MIDNVTTGKKVLSLKQLFSAGDAISISADTNDTTKQKISVAVDGTTVKISGNKLISQLITPISGSAISISADHKISVGYDNVTIKNVGGKLASGLTVA